LQIFIKYEVEVLYGEREKLWMNFSNTLLREPAIMHCSNLLEMNASKVQARKVQAELNRSG